MRRYLLAGSFDPPTLGHLDLLRRGAALGDELLVAVLANSAKSTVFSLAERVGMLEKILAAEGLSEKVRVCSYSGLLPELYRQEHCQAVLRGLRNAQDYAYEEQLAAMYRLLDPQIELLYLPARPELAALSSTFVRELAHYHAAWEPWLPAAIVDLAKAGFARAFSGEERVSRRNEDGSQQ